MRIILMCILIVLTLCLPAYATDYAVCPPGDGRGATNGADWDNCYDGMPASPGRGDTYYVKEGSYNSITISTAVSGTSWIKVWKATDTAHGPANGWINGDGSDQAIFAIANIDTSYVEIDGRTGSGSSGHGIKLAQVYTGGSGIGNINLKRLEITTDSLLNAVMTIGSINTNVAISAFKYPIDTALVSYAGTTEGIAPGNDVIPQGKYGAVAFDIGSDGTVDIIEATDNATGYDTAALATTGLPNEAANHFRIGRVTASKSDGAFTFGVTALDAANTTVAYTEELGMPRGIVASTVTSNLLVDTCYIHHVGMALTVVALSGLTVQDCVIGPVNNFADQRNGAGHGQVIQVANNTDTVLIQRNTCIDCEGQAFIYHLRWGKTHTGYTVINNLFYFTGTRYTFSTGAGYARGFASTGRLIGCGYNDPPYGGSTCTNMLVANNTFSNFASADSATDQLGIYCHEQATCTGITYKNNLHFSNVSSPSPVYTSAATTGGNWYSTGDYAVTTDDVTDIKGDTTNPFTSSATYDFTLKNGSSPIDAGVNLSANITSDFVNSPRPRNVFDIGCYEYQGVLGLGTKLQGVKSQGVKW